MIEIDSDKTIYINRGDDATIVLTANQKTYDFKPNDIITLRVYDKRGYDKNTLLEKKFTITDETKEVNLLFDEQDTEFAPMANKALTYWYDVSLNETQTIIGYDDDGAKKFIVRPAKMGGEK